MHFPMYIKIIYARFVMFRLTSTGLMDKKCSESTILSLLRKEKAKDRQMEDNTILWGKKEGRREMVRRFCTKNV